jgi:hypothetical protein
MTSQVIAVKNNTNATIASVKVECGFYSGEVLSGSGFAYLHDIEPGQTVQGEVVGFFGVGPDRTDCRISNIINRFSDHRRWLPDRRDAESGDANFVGTIRITF